MARPNSAAGSFKVQSPAAPGLLGPAAPADEDLLALERDEGGRELEGLESVEPEHGENPEPTSSCVKAAFLSKQTKKASLKNGQASAEKYLCSQAVSSGARNEWGSWAAVPSCGFTRFVS